MYAVAMLLLIPIYHCHATALKILMSNSLRVKSQPYIVISLLAVFFCIVGKHSVAGSVTIIAQPTTMYMLAKEHAQQSLFSPQVISDFIHAYNPEQTAVLAKHAAVYIPSDTDMYRPDTDTLDRYINYILLRKRQHIIDFAHAANPLFILQNYMYLSDVDRAITTVVDSDEAVNTLKLSEIDADDVARYVQHIFGLSALQLAELQQQSNNLVSANSKLVLQGALVATDHIAIDFSRIVTDSDIQAFWPQDRIILLPDNATLPNILQYVVLLNGASTTDFYNTVKLLNRDITNWELIPAATVLILPRSAHVRNDFQYSAIHAEPPIDVDVQLLDTTADLQQPADKAAEYIVFTEQQVVHELYYSYGLIKQRNSYTWNDVSKAQGGFNQSAELDTGYRLYYSFSVDRYSIGFGYANFGFNTLAGSGQDRRLIASGTDVGDLYLRLQYQTQTNHWIFAGYGNVDKGYLQQDDLLKYHIASSSHDYLFVGYKMFFSDLIKQQRVGIEGSFKSLTTSPELQTNVGGSTYELVLLNEMRISPRVLVYIGGRFYLGLSETSSQYADMSTVYFGADLYMRLLFGTASFE